MIEDLNHKYEIVGMSKEDIVNLLGKGYSVTGKNDEQLYYYFIKEVDDYTLYYYEITIKDNEVIKAKRYQIGRAHV